mmetsp:Transcript_22627/g.53631  ORF Transcript_22627/g.53631 Transcript_22627/m.53631 type:complete len:129 (-) Transcript_22627:232-618(-)
MGVLGFSTSSGPAVSLFFVSDRLAVSLFFVSDRVESDAVADVIDSIASDGFFAPPPKDAGVGFEAGEGADAGITSSAFPLFMVASTALNTNIALVLVESPAISFVSSFALSLVVSVIPTRTMRSPTNT